MEKIIISFIFIVLAFNAASISNVNAATINAASCSQEHVQAAIETAKTGDIVIVPSGKCEWAANVIIPDAKKITLQGAGIDSTVITNPLKTAVELKMGNSGSRLTGFTFNGIIIRLFLGDARIDHNKFDRSISYQLTGVHFSSNARAEAHSPSALVDNNIFVNNRVVVFAGPMLQNKAWTIPVDLGGATNTVYIENNAFYRTDGRGGNAVDANYGGAYVFRYNSLYSTSGYWNTMTHSVQGPNRATRKFEFYGNIFHSDTVIFNPPFFLRAGTGVVFNNYISGVYRTKCIDLDNVRSLNPHYSRYPADIDACNGTSKWDGNEGKGDEAGYPCRDQIGRGYDTELWIRFPAGAYAQPLLPVYGWSNRTDGNSEAPFRVRKASGKHIKANRDFYDYTASFDGTSGVGAGTLANRPKTCTPGVAYWATNQSISDLTGMVGKNPKTPIIGTLYKCTASNTWTTYYSPYTYPHPLSRSSMNP